MSGLPDRAGRALLLALPLLALPLLGSGCFSTVEAPGPAPLELLEGRERFSHDAWGEVLRRVVDDRGRVDYQTLVADPSELERVVALQAAVGPETRPELFPTDADRLAYHLNAYNALVMWQVVERWPLDSVAEDKASFFYFTRLPLDGGAISLYDLENDVVRGRYDEPRIHFALNCASGGCPMLPREPFRADALEDQLARETARFLGDPRNVRLEDGVLLLSSILEWYAEDFEPSPREWVAARRPGLSITAETPVAFLPYDWSLNAQP